MITIIADPHTYRSTPEGAIVAKHTGDYVALRQALRRALDEHSRLTVHVTNRLVLRWLDDLSIYTSEIHWERVEPEEDFRRMFTTEPLHPFTPDLLIALDIGTIPPPSPNKQVDPLSWILGQRLAEVWSYPTADDRHLAQLITWAIASREAIPEHLQPLMQTQLMNWGEQHTIYRLLHVGSLYADSLRLVRRWALSRYDERWQREQGFAALPIMKVPAERDACVIAIRDLVPALNAYWSYHFAETELTIDHLQSAIDRMSGVSEAELTTIIRLLRRQPTLISTPVVTQLRRRFSELPESNQHIRELNELIQPSRPHMPDPNWLPDRWLQWATNEYMPYFSWTIRAEQPRDYQQQCALSFGEWLAEQYPRFLNNDASPLLIRQFTLMRDLLRNDPQAIVVWLIVDGMTWWQSIRLLEECRQQNLFAQRVEPSIAMLPSITSISKRALVTGLPSVEPRQQSIAVAAREQLARAGISSYVGYSLSQALEVLRQPAPPRCAIVLYNALDQLAHNMTTFSDNEGIRGCLRGLAQDLAKMKQVCNEHGNIFHALIGSDHGSTLLPSDAPLRRLPQATREITDIWEDDLDQEGASSASHRAAVIIDSQRLVIDHPEHWYILDKDRYQLNQSYLVPRGYGYVTRKPTGWTHGGLTPEEVVVPLIHLASEPLQVLQAIVRITGSLRSRQATNLTLEVVNPNAAPLNEIAFQIADLEPLHIDQIAAGSTLTQQIHFPARPIDGAELVIQWSLICAILGTPYEQRGREVLSVRRLQTEDTLDDFFS